MNSIERAQQRLARLSRSGVQVTAPAVIARGTEVDVLRPHQQVSLDRQRLRQLFGAGIEADTPSAQTAAVVFRSLGAALMSHVHGQPRAGAGSGPLETTVAVVSAREGDGKTFCAWQVAVSLLQQQVSSVLLVDACGGVGSLTQGLGLPADQGGLHAVLSGQTEDWTQVVLGTDWPGLQVLPMTSLDMRLDGQPALARWRRFLGGWLGRHTDRWVVLDMPALVPTSRTWVPLQSVGQVVVVSRNGQPWSEVQSMAQMLSGCPVAWGVLNPTGQRHERGVRAG